MKFVRSTVITFLTNVFMFGVSLITTIVTARMLGTSGSGILGVVNATITFSIIILGFGISTSNVYYTGKNKSDASSVIGINILISIFSAVCIFCIYLLNLKYNFKIFNGLGNDILIITFSIIPFMNLKSLLINVLLGLGEAEKYNAVNTIDTIVTFIFLCVMVFSFKTPYWVTVSYMISVIIVLIIIFYILFMKDGLKVSFKPRLFKDMMKYGFKAQLGNLIQQLNYRLDVFICNAFLTSAQVGIYVNAVKFGETLWKISGSVGTIVFPVVSSSQDNKDMDKFINKVVRISFYIVVLCSILLALFSKIIIFILLGRKYLPCVTPLILILPGITIFAVSNVISSYLAGVGMIMKNVIASIISGVITVILDLVLIPAIGINGAAITSSISYTIFTIVILYFYCNLTKSKLSELFILKKSDLEEIIYRVNSFIKKFKRA